ncbi:MAG: 23S rRNA (uracil(1939)-C(5))-methyltransferase RlmD [Oscillospiraceae bacterium]|nr:23S rRNA (uracil(1939)-C(5))-methyltransferase RlmD [Oscillospiraceae bacterium]
MTKQHCRLFKRCGGCQLQESYPEQLIWKQNRVRRYLSEFGECASIIGMENPYYYRNKVQHGFYTNPSRRIISGIFQSGSGRIVPCESCLLEDQQAGRMMTTIKELMQTFRIFPYNPKTGNGLLRHVMIRKGYHSGEYLVCLVTSKSMLPSKRNFVAALRKAHPCITTIVQNVCTNPMPLTMGEQENVLYGKGYIEDMLCGKRFRISAGSFYQVNPVQTEILYSTAMRFAALTAEDRVLDCYCGTGTIGIIASSQCKEVFGVECNPSAVADAEKNAQANSCKNVRFFQEDSGRFMEQMAQAGETADVVFTDPPRTGSDKRFLESLAKLAPKRIVYISCGIETLARDLRILVQRGYQISAIQPVDMFPHTKHVETVILLSRKDVHERIKFDVNVEDLIK